jgi:putative ABC transport system substrate-binding protein
MRRRDFITLFGGAAAWPLAARAQQADRMRLVGVLLPAPEGDRDYQTWVGAFLQALQELGWIDGRNIRIETRWATVNPAGIRKQAAELAELAPDVILAPGTSTVRPLLQATRTVPIVFPIIADPVSGGLVDSLARPGGNATGINFFVQEAVTKRLGLLHELVPKAVRIAVLVNPANASTAETTLRDVQEAARALGLEIQVLNASTRGEIETAFATLVRDRAHALLVGPDGFFGSRRVQIATLAARYVIPASYSNRGYPEVGGLMSYGTDNLDMFRQVGVYTGKILKGAKPAELPVLQSTKFEFVINLQTARALDLEVPNSMQLLADEVIE